MPFIGAQTHSALPKLGKPALFELANLPCLALQTCLVWTHKPALFALANLPCLDLQTCLV
jgi:hypothetical protein